MKSKTPQLLLACLAAASLSGCVGTKPVVTTTGTAYSESLAPHRIRFEAPKVDVQTVKTEQPVYVPKIEYSIKTNVDALLVGKVSEMTTRNRDITGFSGYKVLVYSGFDRDVATEVKRNVETFMPGQAVALEYDQPNFRVKVGGFLSRTEAYQLYVQLNQQFTEANVIKDVIKRNEVRF